MKAIKSEIQTIRFSGILKVKKSAETKAVFLVFTDKSLTKIMQNVFKASFHHEE